MIYVSGKIGKKEITTAVRRKFDKVTQQLVKQGWAVVNPASEPYQEEMQENVKEEEAKWQDLDIGKFDWYSWVLLYDLHMVALADAIYMLRDWKDSPGATAEHEFAKATGKYIFYQD